MSMLSEFRATEAHIKQLMERLEALKQDSGLQIEMEFETRVRDLMAEYGMSLVDIMNIFGEPIPQKTKKPAKSGECSVDALGRVRNPRRLVQYRNPHTGEVVESKGGNNKMLREWRETWGEDKVAEWATVLE